MNPYPKTVDLDEEGGAAILAVDPNFDQNSYVAPAPTNYGPPPQQQQQQYQQPQQHYGAPPMQQQYQQQNGGYGAPQQQY